MDVPRSRLVFFASQLGAALLTVVAVAQLFTFEDFPAVLSAYPLPGGYPTSFLLAALLVTVEVLAVPYLLMMRLSPLMRLVSLLCGWLSCLVWLAIGLYLVAHDNAGANSGFLGATIAARGGLLPLAGGVTLAVCLSVVRPVRSR